MVHQGSVDRVIDFYADIKTLCISTDAFAEIMIYIKICQTLNWGNAIKNYLLLSKFQVKSISGKDLAKGQFGNKFTSAMQISELEKFQITLDKSHKWI